jgi:hypothetical protein
MSNPPKKSECGCLWCEDCGWVGLCCGECDSDCSAPVFIRVKTLCPTCSVEVPQARVDYGFNTCVKHSNEKEKDHKPGVVNSLGLHEKYFPEGR